MLCMPSRISHNFLVRTPRTDLVTVEGTSKTKTVLFPWPAPVACWSRVQWYASSVRMVDVVDLERRRQLAFFGARRPRASSRVLPSGCLRHTWNLRFAYKLSIGLVPGGTTSNLKQAEMSCRSRRIHSYTATMSSEVRFE